MDACMMWYASLHEVLRYSLSDAAVFCGCCSFDAVVSGRSQLVSQHVTVQAVSLCFLH